MGLRLLADMGISHRVQMWLQGQGHDVVHLRDEGLHRLSDDYVLRKAAREQRAVLTFDLDFGELVARAKGERVGVVLFRLNDTTTSFVLQRLRSVLGDVEAELTRGALVVVEDGRHRVRRSFASLDAIGKDADPD